RSSPESGGPDAEAARGGRPAAGRPAGPGAKPSRGTKKSALRAPLAAARRPGAAPDRHAARAALDARLHQPAPVETERAAAAVALPELRQQEHAADDRDGEPDRQHGAAQVRGIAPRLRRRRGGRGGLRRGGGGGGARHRALAETTLHAVSPN